MNKLLIHSFASRAWLTHAARMLLVLVAACTTVACSVVKVRDAEVRGTKAALHGNVLDSGYSDAVQSALQSAGLDPGNCLQHAEPCLQHMQAIAAPDDEAWLLAMAELHLSAAGPTSATHAAVPPLAHCVEAARYAYATGLSAARPSRNAARLRDIYNEAAGCVALTFLVNGGGPDEASPRVREGRIDIRMPDGQRPPEWIDATRLRTEGLRHAHRRDGFGAALVAVADVAGDDAATPLLTPRYVPATAVVRFEGDTPGQVIRGSAAIIDVLDPYASETLRIGAHDEPLAADFTAPYALWLARSRLKRQGDRALVQGETQLDGPRVYAMQPFDPDRRIVVLLHGLGSSPETWADVANDILGDDELRRRYQLWQVFYPTNLPIAENLRSIRGALRAALASVETPGEASASDHLTLVGHSMGGVIARLLVVDSGDALWRALLDGPVDAAQRQRLALLDPYLTLTPMPEVDRIILMAAPHRGSPKASSWLGRAGSRLVGLPKAALQTIASVADAIQGDAPQQAQALRERQMDSVEALSDQGRYLRTTATLQIAHGVAYHSIIGRKDPSVPLEASSDGLVPYSSSHLEGAMSELIVTSGHGVQQTPEAIFEVRRILREAATGSSPAPRGALAPAARETGGVAIVHAYP